MATAQLPRQELRGPTAESATRARVLSLVTEIHDGERLALAAELLSEIVAYHPADTRSLTVAEIEALDRVGLAEAELLVPRAPSASARTALWERQAELDTYTVTEVAALLGVTAARVRQRCSAQTLIAQRRRDGWHLPRFQFPDGREVRGWAGLAPAISQGTPFIVAERVLTTPSLRLTIDGEALAPFEWLAQGGDASLAAAVVHDTLHRLP